MNNSVISFNNVSKKYGIRKGFFKKEDFLALNNVSFEIAKGASLGVVGRNGAGKTTILRLLANIIEPTTGEIRVRGKISTLIDLGSGFNYELDGRENIDLQGSVLGLSRKEIRKKFDKIIEFAELSKFIDEPLKHYSSGMLLRLGFAIAAHIDSDVLLVDEVLAVGDINFRRKCIDKLQEFITQKKTFVIVSHDLHMIRSICGDVIYLVKGAVKESGSAEKAIGSYIEDSYTNCVIKKDASDERNIVMDRITRKGTGEVRAVEVKIKTKDGKETDEFEINEDITVEIHYKAVKKIEDVTFMISIIDIDNNFITQATADVSIDTAGEGVLQCMIKAPPLLPDIYRINTVIMNKIFTSIGDSGMGTYDCWERASGFKIISKKSVYMLSSGILRINYEWKKIL